MPHGRHDRTMVVDVRETLIARAADQFLQIRPGSHFAVLTARRALARNQPVDRALIEKSGLTRDLLTDLVER